MFRDPDFWEDQLKVETCVACNGYYGPCFGEPVCATCHAFLYASHLELELLIPEVRFIPIKPMAFNEINSRMFVDIKR